jgi:nucleoside-diphosphate-sugar epimerase
MRVLVTGGTGFVGAHTVAALAAAGHTVRLLVRDPDLVGRCVAPLGAAVDEVQVGDITDEAAVAAAVDGCDAVVHAAASVGVGGHHAAGMDRTNVDGTRIVLDAAVGAGCDPVVHVSSVAALFPPEEPFLHPDSPVGSPTSPYGRSKAAAEHHARHLQALGMPIVVVYPAMVLGPPAGHRGGPSAEAVSTILDLGTVTVSHGGWSVVDVRDVAATIVAALEPGRGPRRYTAGGRFLDMEGVAALLEEVTGRHLHRVPAPDWLARTVGHVADLAQRVLPVHLPVTHEGVEYLLRAVPCDDSATQDDLGVTFRPAAETVADTIAGLVRNGVVPAGRAGTAAEVRP